MLSNSKAQYLGLRPYGDCFIELSGREGLEGWIEERRETGRRVSISGQGKRNRRGLGKGRTSTSPSHNGPVLIAITNTSVQGYS